MLRDGYLQMLPRKYVRHQFKDGEFTVEIIMAGYNLDNVTVKRYRRAHTRPYLG